MKALNDRKKGDEMLKYRMNLVVIGILVALMGAYPLLSNVAFMQDISKLLPAGSTAYQALLILIGIIAIGYGIKSQKARQLKEK